MSVVEDPFGAVKKEVVKSLENAKNLFERYNEVSSESPATFQEREWICTELRNTLRSIEWDLEDLDETIEIVVKNPKKFRFSDEELQRRREFVTNSNRIINDIKEKMATSDNRFRERNGLFSAFSGSPNPTADQQQSARNQYKYSKLQNDFDGPSGSSAEPQLIRNTLEKQQLIMRNQDEDLEKMGGSVHVLKNISAQIGGELDEQSVMLDDIGTNMTRTESKLDNVMKKIAKVTHMSNDKRQWYAILALVLVILIIVILFAVL